LFIFIIRVQSNNGDSSAGRPHLRGTLAVPSEAEYVLAGLNGGRDMHLVNHFPLAVCLVSTLLLHGPKGVGSPLGAMGEGAFGSPLGMDLSSLAGGMVALVDNPLFVTMEVQLQVLETFFGHMADTSMWHLTEAV